jgi:hypothetical protein
MMLPRLEKETVFMKASSRMLSQGIDTSRGTKGRSLLDEMDVVPANVAVLVLFFEVVEAERDLFQKRDEPCSLSDGRDPDSAKSIAVSASVAGALTVAPSAVVIVGCALTVGVLDALELAVLAVPRHKG